MTAFIYANNIQTTLATAITSSATTIALASASNLPASIPSGYYLVITLNDAATRQLFEVMYATAISGNTLTVIRGQEGTGAQSWLVGDLVYSGPTAGQMQQLAGSVFTNPMTTTGDMMVGTTGGVPARLAIGASGYVLTSSSGTPTWSAPAVAGVASFNARTGAVTLNSGDVTTALSFTPFPNTGGAIGGNVTVTGTLTVDSTVEATTFIAEDSFALGPWTITTNGTALIFTNVSSGNTITFGINGSIQAQGTIQAQS